MTRFIPMQESELMSLKDLAEPIWQECYADILPQKQIDLLLCKYFSPAALRRSADEGMRYETVLDGDDLAGFIAYQLKEGYLYLDKLYLKKSCRGRHIAAKTMRYLDRFALPIRLNVNQKNLSALAAYRKNGFEVLYRETILLPDGYRNNDFVMNRPYPIRPAAPQDLPRLSAEWRGDTKDLIEPCVCPPIQKSETLVYDDITPRGFIALDKEKIQWLHVPEKYQRAGVAGALLNAAARTTKKPLTACIYAKNKSAVEFFRAKQFTVIKNENDMLTMKKTSA